MSQADPTPDDLLAAFYGRLLSAERAAVYLLGKLAEEHGSGLYLVGGSVRDLLVGRGHLDLDFVVEADARAVARAFARATGAPAVTHDAFGTAVVADDALTFDLVTAREERYPTPGALPVVRPASLAEDLARRDFTINAMALAIAGPRAGELIDPHGGRDDLAARTLRVLHDASFRDDATRLWRAGRYLARLDLRLFPHTESLLRRDLAYLDAISPTRIHHELVRTLAEPAPERTLRALDRIGVLSATYPPLRFTAEDAATFPWLRRRGLNTEDARTAMIATFGARWSPDEAAAAAELLALTRPERSALVAVPPLLATLVRLIDSGARPGAITLAIERFPEPALAAVAGRFPDDARGQNAAAFLDRWRYVRPILSAARLEAMGVPKGPLLGEILRILRAACIDSDVQTEEDEERLVREWLRKT